MSQPTTNPIARVLSRPAYASIAGAVVLLAVVFFWKWPTSMLMGYLAGWTFWLGVPLGTMGLKLIHRMSGGDWGKQLLDDSSTRIRPLTLMAILFIPVLVGMKWLYPWMTHGVLEPLEESHFRHWYMREGFFVARSVAYFLIWIGISLTGAAAKPNRWPVGTAGVCFVLMMVTITLASLDWLAMLSSDFYSTIFGLYLMMAFGVTALCVMIISATIRFPEAPLKRMNDWGNLLLTFVILHAYMAFSQFLIVWSGNLPREVAWYDQRNYGAWGAIALMLIVVQFFIPFLVLLFRDAKQKRTTLAATAGGMLAATWIEAAWLVIPSLKEHKPQAWECILAVAVMVIVSAGIGLFISPRLLWTSTTPVAATGEEAHG